MIAIDTNILVYAHREDSEFHANALSALKSIAESGQSWAIPWPCIHEFLSIVTHPKIYNPPTPMAVALESVASWIDSPYCQTLGEESGYFNILKQSALGGKVAGPMIHDARIASLCMVHGVAVLWTADRDFSRFGKLKTTNPLLSNL